MSLATAIVSLALASPAPEAMSPTAIRIIAAVIGVLALFVIVARRKKMAARRKPIA